MSVKALLFFNKFFSLPLHPFNMQNDGVKSDSKWQYEKGIETIKFYLEFCDRDRYLPNAEYDLARVRLDSHALGSL